MILLIDNYDSFTFNLYQMIAKYEKVRVVRNDDALLQKELTEFSKIIISPGPGHPKEAGLCMNIIQKMEKEVPILGICLGHQAIIEAFGGDVIQAQEIMHGKTSEVCCQPTNIFHGLPTNFSVMRYHSLTAKKETLPNCFEILAETKESKLIMAIKHKEYPVYGIQFHPESYLTQYGEEMIKNFILGEKTHERSTIKAICS